MVLIIFLLRNVGVGLGFDRIERDSVLDLESEVSHVEGVKGNNLSVWSCLVGVKYNLFGLRGEISNLSGNDSEEDEFSSGI